MFRTILMPSLVALALGSALVWQTSSPTAATPVPEGMTAERMAALRKVIRPCEGEDAFDKIAWLTTIHDARVKAAAEGKPILLWEMDGHPLGCG